MSPETRQQTEAGATLTYDGREIVLPVVRGTEDEVAPLATFYQEPETDKKMSETAVRLIAKMPTLAAYSYKHSIGQPFMYPRNSLDYSANFLHMMFTTPCEDVEPDPLLARTLDLLL